MISESKISISELLISFGFIKDIYDVQDGRIYGLYNDPGTDVRIEIRTKVSGEIHSVMWEDFGRIHNPGDKITFEQALASVNELSRDNMLFHLDVFTDLDGGRYEKYNY
jgi:hypothetical protein